MRLEQGKSYLWLFPIHLVLFAAGFGLCGAFGNATWGIVTMPLFIAFLMICELRSGIALDSWWRAAHPKGRWQYQAILAWQAFALVWFLAIAYFFIR
jgi:hypothetical protein